MSAEKSKELGLHAVRWTPKMHAWSHPKQAMFDERMIMLEHAVA